jgi:hypothetical protein
LEITRFRIQFQHLAYFIKFSSLSAETARREETDRWTDGRRIDFNRAHILKCALKRKSDLPNPLKMKLKDNWF